MPRIVVTLTMLTMVFANVTHAQERADEGCSTPVATCADGPAEKEAGEKEKASREDLLIRLREKLEKNFVTSAPWKRTLGEAVSAAAETERPILAYFTRSDAPCPACDKLESGPLASEEFLAVCDEVVPYLHVTSQLEDASEPGLIEERGGKHFPYLVFLDNRGDPLFDVKISSCEGEIRVENLDLALKDASLLLESRSKLEKKRRHKISLARVRMIEALREIQHVDLATLEQDSHLLKKEEDLLERFSRYRILRPIQMAKKTYDESIHAATQLGPSDPQAMRETMNAARSEVQQTMYTLYKEGKTIDDAEDTLYEYFWKNVVESAIGSGDKRTAAIAHNALIKVVERNPILQGYLVGCRQKIEGM